MRLNGATNIDQDATRGAGSLNRTDAETDTPLRVLLVEDSPLIRERLAESIADPGRIEIVARQTASKPRSACSPPAPWDAMVLDLQLRHGWGLACCAH
jgi:response regulator RpfG family c-di-GMP phosphodiesterase